MKMPRDWGVATIKFTFDMNGRYEYPVMELCNPDKSEICMIKNVKDLSIVVRFTTCSEVSFTAYSEYNGVKMPYFDKLEKSRLIHIEGFGYFVIQGYTRSFENKVYSKTITAYSAEFTLNNKGVNLTFVTTSDVSTTTYSKTYKFWDELDRYSDTPVSLLGNLFKICPQWTIGYVSASLRDKYRSFQQTDNGLFGFLTNEVSESYEALFLFDPEEYTVNAYDSKEIVKSTDIVLTFDNLIKNATIEELSTDVYTVLNVSGADNLSIVRINPIGTKQLFKLDYYVGSLDSTSSKYYKTYNDWISDEALKLKVLTWENDVREQMENFQENKNSYGYMLNLQKQFNLMLLTQKAAYTDAKTDYESAQLLFSDYLDDQNTKTSSGNTTRYNYWRKKQYAYEYNMNVLTSGGRLYDTDNEALFDSADELGSPTGATILSAVTEDNPSAGTYSINALTEEVNSLSARRDNIVNTYAYEKYFTAEEREILEPYIREGDYQDSSFIITDTMNIPDYSNSETYVETTNGVKKIKDLQDVDVIIDADYVALQLLTAGYDRLDSVCEPSFSFSMDTANFLFIEKFAPFINQIAFGSMINVELSDGDWVYPFLQEMQIQYDNPESFSMTFGNRFRLSSAEWTYSEIHNDTTSAVSSVNSLLSAAATPVTNGTIDRVTSYMQNSLIAANQSIQATEDNEFSFGGYGLRGRKRSNISDKYNGYEPEQIWISNNKINFTDDGWDTTKTVLGKLPGGTYGLVSERMKTRLLGGERIELCGNITRCE